MSTNELAELFEPSATPAPAPTAPRPRWEHRWKAQALVFLLLVAVAAPLDESLLRLLTETVEGRLLLLELRTAPQGHPSYVRICREMHRQIAEVAGHRLIAGAMRFVGLEDVHLPRYAAEAARRMARR